MPKCACQIKALIQIESWHFYKVKPPLALEFICFFVTVTVCVRCFSFYISVNHCYSCCAVVFLYQLVSSPERVCETSYYWLTFVRCVGPWLTGVTVGNWSISWWHLQVIGCPGNIRLKYRAVPTFNVEAELVLPHPLTQLRRPSLYAVWWL